MNTGYRTRRTINGSTFLFKEIEATTQGLDLDISSVNKLLPKSKKSMYGLVLWIAISVIFLLLIKFF